MIFKLHRVGLTALLPTMFFGPTFSVSAHAGPPPATQNDPQLQKAIELYKEGEYFQAVAPLVEILKRDERNAEALLYLGLCYAKLNNHEEALEKLRKAQKLASNKDAIHIGLAEAYLAIGDVREALKSAEAAVRLGPGNPEALSVLTRASIRMESFNRAYEAATALYKVAPKDEKNLVLLVQTTYFRYASGYVASQKDDGKQKTERLRQANLERLAIIGFALGALQKHQPATPTQLTADLRNEAINLQNFLVFEKSLGVNLASDKYDSLAKPPKAESGPKMQVPEEARQYGISGKINVIVLVSETGSVLFGIPLQFYPYGLTEEAIRTATGFKFKPATFDGKPVRALVRLDVNFNTSLGL